MRTKLSILMLLSFVVLFTNCHKEPFVYFSVKTTEILVNENFEIEVNNSSKSTTIEWGDTDRFVNTTNCSEGTGVYSHKYTTPGNYLITISTTNGGGTYKDYHISIVVTDNIKIITGTVKTWHSSSAGFTSEQIAKDEFTDNDVVIAFAKFSTDNYCNLPYTILDVSGVVWSKWDYMVHYNTANYVEFTEWNYVDEISYCGLSYKIYIIPKNVYNFTYKDNPEKLAELSNSFSK